MFDGQSQIAFIERAHVGLRSRFLVQLNLLTFNISGLSIPRTYTITSDYPYLVSCPALTVDAEVPWTRVRARFPHWDDTTDTTRSRQRHFHRMNSADSGAVLALLPSDDCIVPGASWLLEQEGINATSPHLITSGSAGLPITSSYLSVLHNNYTYLANMPALSEVLPKNPDRWYKQTHLVRLNFCVFSLFMFGKIDRPRLCQDSRHLT